MSDQAPVWYVQQWIDGTISEYQARGFELRHATSPPVKMVGEKLHFLIAGKGEAETDVKRGDEAVPMNLGRTKIELDTTKDRAFEEVYEDDLDQMTVDEMQVVRDDSARALGRAHTRKIYTELRTSTNITGSYASVMTPLQGIKARQQLQSRSVRPRQGSLFWALDSVSWNNMMTFDVVASSDYVGPDLPFVNGNLARTWDGIHMFQLDDSLLGIDPAAPTEVDCMMWDKDAIGFGWVRQLMGNVQWDNRKDCWTHNMRMRNAAKVLLPDGIEKVQALYDPAAIALN